MSWLFNPLAGLRPVPNDMEALARSAEAQKKSIFSTPLIPTLFGNAQASSVTITRPQSPSPITHLPVEVLNAIFFELLELAGNAPPRSNRRPSWLTVTQVCGHWRRVAYRHKDLWTNIPLESKEWTKVALEQSKPALIKIQWDKDNHPDGSRPNIEALILALTELSRVQFLWLEERPRERGHLGPSFMDIARTLLTEHPAPNLEILGLETSPTILRLDEELFQGQPPSSLKELLMDGCQISTPSHLFVPSLTFLELDYTIVWETFEDMLDTLTRLPLLQRLRFLNGVAPPADDDEIAASAPIPMAELESFLLHGDRFQVAKTLRSLAIPPTADLHLVLSPHRRSLLATEPAGIAAALGEHFAEAVKMRGSYRTLTITHDLAVPGYISFGLTDPHADNGEPELPALTQIQLIWPAPALAIAVAWPMCARLPIINRLESMEAEHFMLVDAELWPLIDAFAGGLRELTVWREAAYGLLMAFDEDAEKGGERVLFKELRRLCLRRVKFAEMFGGQGRSFDSVLAELKRRLERGSACQLAIEECNLTQEMVIQLQETLGEDGIAWDGELNGRLRADVMDMD